MEMVYCYFRQGSPFGAMCRDSANQWCAVTGGYYTEICEGRA